MVGQGVSLIDDQGKTELVAYSSKEFDLDGPATFDEGDQRWERLFSWSPNDCMTRRLNSASATVKIIVKAEEKDQWVSLIKTRPDCALLPAPSAPLKQGWCTRTSYSIQQAPVNTYISLPLS